MRATLIVICFAAILAIAAALAGTGGSSGWLTPGIAAIVFLLAVVVAMLIALGRKTRAEQGQKLAKICIEHGMAHVPSPDRTMHQRFGTLPGIPWGGQVQSVFVGRLDERPLTVFEHRYTVHTGHVSVPVTHTVYVTEAPLWPTLIVRQRSGLSSLLHRLGVRRSVSFEHEPFNRACRMTTEDEDFAVTLLDPPMQQFMASRPDVRWRIGHGWCAMIYRGPLRLERMGASMQRFRQFWSMVPPELEAWAEIEQLRN